MTAETKTTFTPGPWTAKQDRLVRHRGRVYVEGSGGWRANPICAADSRDDVADLYAAGEAICAAAAEVEAMLEAGEAAPDDSAMWEAIATMRAALRRARREG